MTESKDATASEGPWNPGIQSTLTRPLLALSTIFRPENAFNSLDQAREIHAVSGLPIEQLAILRPTRLALHEVLIRTTADYEIPDPNDAAIDSMGSNLRRIAQTFMNEVVTPSEQEIIEIYNRAHERLSEIIQEEAKILHDGSQSKSNVPAQNRWLKALFGQIFSETPPPAEPTDNEWEVTNRTICSWQSDANATNDLCRAAGLKALAHVVGALHRQYGRINGRYSLLTSLAVNLGCNDYAARMIGNHLDLKIRKVADAKGFKILPRQVNSIAMVTKGASASGKSTMRPFQHELATRMGICWSDFALISPDTWRRALLDYESLGELRKYAGMLTSQEVAIIDRKLDAYLVKKGENQRTSHLLVDRFRFDSFALDSEENQHLPSRFGSKLLYIFMITPPQAIVERGWKRGLEVGRFKAVDDLLAHAIEAYTGMQDILFGRAVTSSTSVHYELLNNDVPRGSLPLTVAFGWGGEMNIFDLKGILDVERFRKVNMNAKCSKDLYATQESLYSNNNVAFLNRCLQRFPRVTFAEPESGRIYALFEHGKLINGDWDTLGRTLKGLDLDSLWETLSSNSTQVRIGQKSSPDLLMKNNYLTLGRWAPRG